VVKPEASAYRFTVAAAIRIRCPFLTLRTPHAARCLPRRAARVVAPPWWSRRRQGIAYQGHLESPAAAALPVGCSSWHARRWVAPAVACLPAMKAGRAGTLARPPDSRRPPSRTIRNVWLTDEGKWGAGVRPAGRRLRLRTALDLCCTCAAAQPICRPAFGRPGHDPHGLGRHLPVASPG
jgi:hypothetical protein